MSSPFLPAGVRNCFTRDLGNDMIADLAVARKVEKSTIDLPVAGHVEADRFYGGAARRKGFTRPPG